MSDEEIKKLYTPFNTKYKGLNAIGEYLHHIENQLRYLCWTAARVNKLLEAYTENSENEREKSNDD